MRILSICILVAAAACATGCAATPAGSGARSYEPHTMNVLAGVSINRGDSVGAAVGAQYEYRKEQKLGFGAFADVAFADDVTTVVGGAVYWHPADRWTVFGGPGVMFGGDDTAVIARVGGAYTFEWKKFELAPMAWVDLGSDVAVFLGMAMVFHF